MDDDLPLSKRNDTSGEHAEINEDGIFWVTTDDSTHKLWDKKIRRINVVAATVSIGCASMLAMVFGRSVWFALTQVALLTTLMFLILIVAAAALYVSSKLELQARLDAVEFRSLFSEQVSE